MTSELKDLKKFTGVGLAGIFGKIVEIELGREPDERQGMF